MVTAIALDRENSWQGLLDGQSGIKFDQQLQISVARVNCLENIHSWRSQYLLQKATLEAIADANNQANKNSRLEIPLVNCGVVIGSSRSHQRELELLLDARAERADRHLIEQKWWACQPASLSAQIATLLQTQAPVFAPMAACATANWAIAQAAQLIRAGQCEVAIAGATDAAITPLTIAGFQKINVLAKAGIHPFSQERAGFALGEGAATLVLESLASAKRRGANIYGRVLSWGITNDAYHATSPSPDHHSAAIAINDCLERGQIKAADIGYINAHGTATAMNDAREAALISQILPMALVSGTKGATGHALGATGMIEAAFCLLALRDRLVPPCVGLKTPAFDLQTVQQVGRSPDLRYALNFSFGFGGQNAIVAFGQV
jgi:3-oxoacyl-[acyl-carrier-protein] synthase II